MKTIVQVCYLFGFDEGEKDDKDDACIFRGCDLQPIHLSIDAIDVCLLSKGVCGKSWILLNLASYFLSYHLRA